MSGVTRLKLELQSGADRLTLTGVRFPRGIFLRLGDGNDTVVLDRVDAGPTRIRTGDGYDVVRVSGPSRCRHLALLTGRGPDSIVVDDVWISGDLYVDTGADDDDVTVFLARIDDDARVYLGRDDDVLVLEDIWVDGDTDLDGQDGDDWLALYGYVELDEDVDIDGFHDDCVVRRRATRPLRCIGRAWHRPHDAATLVEDDDP